MLHTTSIFAPGGHSGCELPPACQSHSQGIWHLWAGLWETETFARVREDGKEADKVWWHSPGGCAQCQREGCSEGLETRGSTVWDRCTLKRLQWGLPLLQHRERVTGKEHHAEIIVLWPSASSPANTSVKDLGGTEHTAKVKGCWDPEGENRGDCLRLNLGKG